MSRIRFKFWIAKQNSWLITFHFQVAVPKNKLGGWPLLQHSSHPAPHSWPKDRSNNNVCTSLLEKSPSIPQPNQATHHTHTHPPLHPPRGTVGVTSSDCTRERGCLIHPHSLSISLSLSTHSHTHPLTGVWPDPTHIPREKVVHFSISPIVKPQTPTFAIRETVGWMICMMYIWCVHDVHVNCCERYRTFTFTYMSLTQAEKHRQTSGCYASSVLI